MDTLFSIVEHLNLDPIMALLLVAIAYFVKTILDRICELEKQSIRRDDAINIIKRLERIEAQTIEHRIKFAVIEKRPEDAEERKH